MKIITFALVGLSTLTLIAEPVKADQAVIQDAQQQTYLEGYNNTSVQEASQSNRTRRARSNSDDAGFVQNSDQYADVVGENLLNAQKVRQSNIDNGRVRQSRKDDCD